MPAQRVHRRADVDESSTIEIGTESIASESRSGSPSQPGIDGTRKRTVANAISASERKLDHRSISPRPPKSSEKPSTRSRLPITEPVSEPRTTSVSPWFTAMQRDDQLGRVAERGVEEAADARARVLGSVLGRLADQPCQRHQRDRREDELGRLVEVGEIVEEDRERPERKAGEEDASDHGRRTLLGRAMATVACGGRAHCLKIAAYVKSCGGGSEAHNPGVNEPRRPRPSSRSTPRTRSSAGAATSTATRSSTPGRVSSGRARSSTRTRRGVTRTWAACRRCSTSRSTSTC